MLAVVIIDGLPLFFFSPFYLKKRRTNALFCEDRHVDLINMDILLKIEPRENVPRKIERILSDMTRQLMSNAAVDEDIEVVVKLQLGQSKLTNMQQPKM